MSIFSPSIYTSPSVCTSQLDAGSAVLICNVCILFYSCYSLERKIFIPTS